MLQAWLSKTQARRGEAVLRRGLTQDARRLPLPKLKTSCGDLCLEQDKPRAPSTDGVGLKPAPSWEGALLPSLVAPCPRSSSAYSRNNGSDSPRQSPASNRAALDLHRSKQWRLEGKKLPHKAGTMQIRHPPRLLQSTRLGYG